MKSTFTILFFFTCSLAFAQKNFVPGNYITPQGDTVQVHINDQNWDRNPKFIEVKRTGSSSDVQKLSAADIKGFSLSSGDRYEAFIGDVDKTPIQIDRLTDSNQSVIVRDTVFLRALVLGQASLYFLKDEQAKEHFYLKVGEENPTELIYRVLKVTEGSKSGYSKLPIYKGMLTAKLTGCPEVTEKAARVEYKLKPLQQLVQAYNGCVSGTKGVFTISEESTTLNILALGGVSYTSIAFSGNAATEIGGQEFTGSNYTFGLSFLFTLPRARGKWAIRNDISYRSLKSDGLYEEGSNVGQENYKRVETAFDMGYAGLSTSIRYKLLEAGIKPYVTIGMANDFMLVNNSNQKIFRRFYTMESTKEQQPLNDYRKYEQAVFLGFGVEMKKILAEIKYERGNGFSAYSALASPRNSFTFQIGYVLK